MYIYIDTYIYTYIHVCMYVCSSLAVFGADVDQKRAAQAACGLFSLFNVTWAALGTSITGVC